MFAPRSIKHCRACGGTVEYRVPADDNRDRATCTVCTTIHYENPVNVVGTLPVWQDKVLLCPPSSPTLVALDVGADVKRTFIVNNLHI